MNDNGRLAAFADWRSNRAFWQQIRLKDGKYTGYYKLKSEDGNRKVPWSDGIKRRFASVEEFHKAAHGWKPKP